MDVSRNDMLGELANDAALERGDYVVQATEQLAKFLDRNRDRISQLGGLTLIDDDPDYLSVAPDCTFRVRCRYEDPTPASGSPTPRSSRRRRSSWSSSTRPRSTRPSPRPRARPPGSRRSPPPRTSCWRPPASRPRRRSPGRGRRVRRCRRRVGRGQVLVAEADDEESAALAMYNLALDFQERSQASEARLIDQFEEAASRLSGKLGDMIIVDDEDERLVLGVTGRFRAEVLPEDADGEWRQLTAPEDIVEFYDPTDVFGDLADTLAEAFPAIAPELEDEDEGEDEGEERGRGRRGRGAGERQPPLARPVSSRRRGQAPPCASPARSSSRAARSCPASGCRRGTPRRSSRAHARASTSTCGRWRPAGCRCAVRTPSRPRIRERHPDHPGAGPASAPAGAWARGLRPGDVADIAGPLGRPFEVDSRSRHLLLVAEGAAIAALRLLIDEAIRDMRSVVLLYGAATASQVYPSSLLPDEVEYVVATADGSLGHPGSVADLVRDYEAWADQSFAAGSPALLGRSRGCRRPAAAAGGGDAGAQAGRRAAAGARLARGPPQELPPGRAGPDDRLCRRHVPGVPVMGASGARSGSAARGRCSPRTSWTGGRSEAEAPGRPRDRTRRTPTVRRVKPAIRAVPPGAPRASRVRCGRPASRLRAPGAPRRPPAGGGRRAAPPSTPWAAGRSTSRWTWGAASCWRNPVIVAAGPFGYGVEVAELVDLPRLGGIVTRGTTLKPRGGPCGAADRGGAGRAADGHGAPEPGSRPGAGPVRDDVGALAVPVILNLCGESTGELAEGARRLEGVPGIAGVELNLSCAERVPRDRLRAGRVGRGSGRCRRPAGVRPAADRQAHGRRVGCARDGAGLRGRGRRRDRAINTLPGLAVAADRRGRRSAPGTAACAVRPSGRSRCASSTRWRRPWTCRSSASAGSRRWTTCSTCSPWGRRPSAWASRRWPIRCCPCAWPTSWPTPAGRGAWRTSRTSWERRCREGRPAVHPRRGVRALMLPQVLLVWLLVINVVTAIAYA